MLYLVSWWRWFCLSFWYVCMFCLLCAYYALSTIHNILYIVTSQCKILPPTKQSNPHTKQQNHIILRYTIMYTGHVCFLDTLCKQELSPADGMWYPPTQAPWAENDPRLSFFCGTSWSQASQSCSQWCPDADDDNACPYGVYTSSSYVYCCCCVYSESAFFESYNAVICMEWFCLSS